VLLLFDIDGTLIRASPKAHQRAMLAAVEQVYGIEFGPGEDPIGQVVPNGKTDRQIVREMLEPRGVAPERVSAGFRDFEQVACELHSASRDEVLSAADSERTAGVLAALAGDGHLLALLTGNLEPIGRHKMELAGLGGFFAPGQGGFGSDAEARAELVPLARGRAALDGAPHPREATVVIGDTPLDVAAALADRVRSIGVAGFRYTRDDLLAAGADAVVDELDELPPVVAGLDLSARRAPSGPSAHP
jgi:phosphoglycolate phosphatase-like HAD superfamily hydrolase